MVIYKILNNNVVVIIDDNGLEQIVMGRGIAFGKKANDTLDQEKIDKVFSLANGDISKNFQELLVDIPVDYVQVGEAIVMDAKLKLGRKLSDVIYVNIVDHIYTAVQRYKKDMQVKNIMLWEIKRFYKNEYYIGLKALDIIEEKLGVRMEEDEAGFIALHIANAELDDERTQDAYQITELMKEITNIVRYEFNVTFDEESVYFYRFITHLKFFSQRLISGKTYEGDGENDLYDIVMLRYPNSFNCVNKIADFIDTKYSYIVSDEEKVYLTIHIERIIYKNKK